MQNPHSIDGIIITQLKKIPDERGTILHMLRRDDPHFREFGEIYFSKVYPGVVKAWHIHSKMTLNYAVITGMVKLVLFDNRKKSKTKGNLMEIFIGDDNYCLVTIPPQIWNGFKGIGKQIAIVANCTDIPHDPTEIDRLDPINNKIIPYTWDIVFK